MKNIIFDCERMKYNHTGLYHYCLQLGRALQQASDPSKETITCYVRPAETAAFGENAKYLPQHSLHKFLMPALRKYDIWHATYQGTQYYPTSRKIKRVLTVHDLNFLYDNKKSAEKRNREIKKLQHKINHTDHIVAISNYVKKDIEQHLQVGKIPISVIYNGCNILEIETPETPSIQPSQPFLYTIGTITDKKNFHVLPALLRNNNFQLIISGITQSEEYKQQIIETAQQHGVADRVLFTGSISENDKQWYLQNCTAFVFPSLAEGFGLPVIEAMHFGKPVFLSNLTALPEIGGDAAYYFENFDAAEMQAVLTNGLQHFNNNQQSKKVMERAAMFNWDTIARQYLDVYRSLY